jgi:hypothetical protein
VMYIGIGMPQSRGLANPPRLAARCYQRKIKIPGTFNSFEAEVEKWIATCVMSRTVVNGVPVRRERSLVGGNASLAALWELIRNRKGERVAILAHYIWGRATVEAIKFRAVVQPGPVPPRPPAIPPPTTAADRATKTLPPPNPPLTPPPSRPLRQRFVSPPRLPKNERNVHKIIDYMKKLLRFLEDANADPKLLERIRRVVRVADISIAALAPVIGLLAWDAVAKRLVLVKALGALHYLEQRALSRFEQLGKIKDLERALVDLESVIDDAERFEITEPRIPPAEPQVTVDPFTRGEASEHFRLARLSNEGYVKLPRNYVGIDAVRGEYRWVNRGGKTIKLYSKPDAVSIKSTHVTNPKALFRQFRNDYLPPLRSDYVGEKLGVRIEGLGRKELHLIFEEGALSQLNAKQTRDLQQALRDMTSESRRSRVVFKWFTWSSGSEEAGPEYLRKLMLRKE